MIIMLMMSLTVMALTLLDGSVEDGVDAPLIETAGHWSRWGRSACLQRLGVDRAMVLMLFSYCWQWCVVSYSMLRTAFFNLGNDGVQLWCWGKWCSWWGSRQKWWLREVDDHDDKYEENYDVDNIDDYVTGITDSVSSRSSGALNQCIVVLTEMI